MLTYGIAPEFRGGVHMKPTYGTLPGNINRHAGTLNQTEGLDTFRFFFENEDKRPMSLDYNSICNEDRIGVDQGNLLVVMGVERYILTNKIQ